MAVRQRHLKRKDGSQPVAMRASSELAMTPDATLGNSSGTTADACTLEQPLTGRTSDGTAFAVPKTRDMLQSLFNPLTPKTTFDIVTLVTLSTHLMVALLFPLATKRAILMAAFAFWRLCYNGGLGWILNWQSSRHGLVAMFKRNGWLDPNRGGKIYLWLKSELEAKMGPDYSFEAVPIEFNAWLLYRQLVDLILLNDFTAYFFLCSCYVGSASDSEPWHAFLRIAGGLILLAFNLWVKIDAHRVVKDYAWYWGDFFFLVEQSLTFDGVFEMAPHPMYSIGYAGYYGGSLITGSYTIFYASLAAHMLQFLFLSLVENPHIEKTYERPPLAVQVIKRSRNRRLSSAQSTHDDTGADEAVASGIASSIRERPTSLWHPDLIIFKNFDLFRASDILIMLLLAYSVGIPLGFMWATGHVRLVLVYSICQCVGWILFRTLALGILLKCQSTNQLITRWYIKRGGNSEEAFSSWRAVCNTATIMTYGSFALVSLAAYHWGDADYSNLILFHTLGLLLIAFHVWSSRSVYETLGDFGWFYGDFFARDSTMLSLAPADIKLYYTGIYRYLNNPEKVIGQAAFYGLALISRSWAVFALALLLQICYFLFSAYVETPHMEKIYGAQMRRESGIVRTVKKAVSLSIGQPLFVGSARYADDGEMRHFSGDMPESSGMANLLASTAKPVKDIILETKGLLSTTTARLAERALPSELSTIDHLGFYGLKLLSGCAWKASSAKTKGVYFLGEPIRVAWQAPLGHSRRDWIGMYPVTANFSNQITTVNSKGHYVYIHPDENLLAEMVVGDSVFAGIVKGTTSVKEHVVVAGSERGSAQQSQKSHSRKRSSGTVPVLQGEALFSSSALPFKVGTYEMRLHHGGTHAVLAQSKPFEIAVCAAKDIISLLGNGDSIEQAESTAPAAEPESLDGLSLALLTVVNKISAVTDSRAIPVAAQGDLDDVCVETDIVEPLESVHDAFSVDEVLDEKQAGRLGYAIKEYFGVEFASDVLIHAAKHGATVHDVAKRIIEARKALSAYSSANF
ncbi:phosphatidylethanolamine N-methyltransferase [Coemansia sp. BCRC 34301]|nr:phosphatidylethanolamine N-methyltransferase [Coemansia sp. BCRC 34301]